MFKPENDAKFTQAVKNLMDTYKDDLALLAQDSFLKEVGILADKYEGNRTSPEFYKEYHALRLQHAPNLANFDKEMQNLQEEYKKTPPVKQKVELQEPSVENEHKYQEGLSALKEKYKDDLAKLELKKFQHAVEKLDTQYEDKSSPEYQQAFAALRLKHAPNLADFDTEVQELQTSLDMPEISDADEHANKKNE